MTTFGFKTIDEFQVSGKTALVRVDFNSPLSPDGSSLADTAIIREHAKTIKDLSQRGAKVVVMAHQGRAGDEDFTSLQIHAHALSKEIGKAVLFVDDVFGIGARQAISALKPGDVLVLENVRFYSEETIEKEPEQQAKTIMVRKLSPLLDLYVGDAFSVAHRKHVSMLGFPKVLPHCVGRVMQEELEALSRALESPAHPSVYLLGGSKPDDSFKVANRVLRDGLADQVLCAGLLGQAVLKAQGLSLGEKNEALLAKKGADKAVLDGIASLQREFPGKLLGPIDVAIRRNGKREEIAISSLPVEEDLMDIGSQTISSFAAVIARAKTIVVNGPAGVYEDPDFMVGTKQLFEAVADSGGYSIMGGGHTISAIDELGMWGRFSHISTAGKALIDFMAGEKLPGIEVLR